jgi:sterol 3beta-glucosyltransferase
MAYMVKNPGLMPGFESLTNGDIKRKTTMLTQIMNGCYKASFSPDPTTGRAFAADAFISNPPSFGHIHIAEHFGREFALDPSTWDLRGLIFDLTG